MLESVRSWALTVCCACVLGALFAMLFPESSSKKLLNMMISLMIVCVMFQPMSDVAKWVVHWEPASFSASSYRNDALEYEVESSAKRIYAAYLEQNLERILDGSGISYERIVVTMDNSDDGCISIGQVEVMVKEKDEAQCEQIKRLLLPYTGKEPVVTSEAP